MKVTKRTKKVEKVTIVDENTYTLELNEKQAATLFILCGQMKPAETHDFVRKGLESYHGHLGGLVDTRSTYDINRDTIEPIYNELKGLFDEHNYKG